MAGRLSDSCQPVALVRLLHPVPLHVLKCDEMLACRERNDGLYRPSTYLLFKMVEEMTVFFFLSLVTTSIVFAPCRLGGSFLLFWLVNFITTATGIGERPCPAGCQQAVGHTTAAHLPELPEPLALKR